MLPPEGNSAWVPRPVPPPEPEACIRWCEKEEQWQVHRSVMRVVAGRLRECWACRECWALQVDDGGTP